MFPDKQTYQEALLDAGAQAARCEFAEAVASALSRSGAALWAFGLADDPHRRAVAIVVQMGGSLASGTIAVLRVENWYAAAALLRQVVEVEYLLWLFAEEPGEAAVWLKASQEDLRRTYSPAVMRKRSQGRFRDQEYWSHCDIGGHPNPRAHFLLPERILPDDESPFGTPEWMWPELGQHLERLWGFFGQCVDHAGMRDVRIIVDSIVEVDNHLLRWHEKDPCAARFRAMPGSESA